MENAVTIEKSCRSGFINSFTLHIIAMALMLLDHLQATVLSDYAVLTRLGRLAFPIFAFMIAEGFYHTKNVKKYLLRMLFFALISEIPFNLMVGSSVFYYAHQNVMWTFLLAILSLLIFEKLKEKHIIMQIIFIPSTVLIFYLIGMFTLVDYHGEGILMVMLFYFTRAKKDTPLRQRLVLMLVQVLGMYYINCEMLKGLVIPVELFGHTFEIVQQGLALLALPIIWCYSTKQGPYNKAIKYFYYLFYPAHLLVLGLIVYFG